MEVSKLFIMKEITSLLLGELLLSTLIEAAYSSNIPEYRTPTTLITCQDDDNCYFGMMCTKNRTCVCSRLYEWDTDLKQCTLNIQKLGLWLSVLKEETDIRGVLDSEANNIFVQLSLAGIMAIILGLSGGLLCVYFFCFQKPYCLVTSIT